MVELSLRERKKLITRSTIARNAERMFGARGFDNVTVAEIADASNVSVKTLFVYFPSKEDLVFADEDLLLHELCAKIRERPSGSSPLAALRTLLEELFDRPDSDPVGGLRHFRRLVGDNPALHARLRTMWEHYERELAAVLADEADAPPTDPAARTSAAMLITPLRLLTSEDVGSGLSTSGDVRPWIEVCLRTIHKGLPDRGPRHK